MSRPWLSDWLGRLARAAPGAFRDDPVFRAAAVGAALALLMLLGQLGGSKSAVPSAAPPSATLGANYGERSARASEAAAASVTGPIAPSRSLNGLVVQPDPDAPADRFGTLGAAHPHRKAPDAQP